MEHKFLSVLLLCAALSLAACGSQVSEVPTTLSPVVQGDPTEGQAELMNALQSAGATVELGDSVEQVFFSVTGRILKVNGADVQVFDYESAQAMEADTAQISEDGSEIRTSMVTWAEAPHFFKSGRILVLYVGEDAAILDLLKSALGEQFAGQ